VITGFDYEWQAPAGCSTELRCRISECIDRVRHGTGPVLSSTVGAFAELSCHSGAQRRPYASTAAAAYAPTYSSVQAWA
jgi:antitoxin (DNA-binding transcriptional repressor) of toxin-antitoxin stability system